jgi:diguanylate cyclase (GGDEF)-like protein/PAS domain S-box-containing protein
VSNTSEQQKDKGADIHAGVRSLSQTVRLPVLTSRRVEMRLGITFGLLVAILIGIGYLGISRMNQINVNLNNVLGRQGTTLQLSRQALAYSSRNSRITMEIFLLTDKRLIGPLLKSRAENTQKISELVTKLDGLCLPGQEQQLLAAVKDTRKPYIASYLRALHLLLDEHKPDTARAVMVEETTPALFKYHSAWENFVQFQMEEMDKAAEESRARYAAARAFVRLLIVLAVFIATAIALFATRRMAGEVELQGQKLELAETMCVEETKAREGFEDELRHSEERLRLATEAARMGVWDWNITKDELVWSDTCKALLGLPPDTAASFQVLMDSVHPDDREPMQREINAAIQQKRDYTSEFRVLWADGSVHWLAASGHAFYDQTGRANRMTGVYVDIDKRKLAEQRLHLQAAALEAAANAIVITDRKGTIHWTNRAFSDMTGYAPEDAVGKNPRLLRSGTHDKAFYNHLWQTITAGKIWRGEVTNRRKNGTLYTEEMSITPVRTERGEITHFVGIKQDITSRMHAAQELRDRESKLRLILESTAEAIYGIDLKGRCTFCNPACIRLLGYEHENDLLGKNMHDLIHHSGRDGTMLPQEKCRIFRAFQGGQGVHVDDEVLWKADGTSFPVEYWSYPQRKGEGIVGAVVAFTDITERRSAEERIRHLAYYDALTGLPNRMLFQDRLVKALASARRRGEKVALLFLDLDQFKTINDSLGHSVGDLLLQEIAERLKKWAREQDTVTRLGGDEFVVVLNAVKEAADAAVAADRLMKAIAAACVVQEHSLTVTCSLGISVFPDHGTDGETLIKNADAAMYWAKGNGRNSFQFFTQDMNGRALERLTLENSLRLALENKELFLEYQPQVDLATGTIVGAEALLRWSHPELGLITPDKFIPIAENSGMIIPIGEWVLRTACTQARKWQDEGLPPLPMAVNVSAVQFRQERFLPAIRDILDETGLAPEFLELELTEGLLLSTTDVMLSALQQLKDMGLKMSIDDFGTGYSSLSYLRDFPVYKLKIDRSFVKAMTVNPDDAAITTTIISMAKTLNLKVIAEGVETEEQMAFLQAHNCDEAQGYYFAKPLAAGDFAEKVRSTERDLSDSCRAARAAANVT